MKNPSVGLTHNLLDPHHRWGLEVLNLEGGGFTSKTGNILIHTFHSNASSAFLEEPNFLPGACTKGRGVEDAGKTASLRSSASVAERATNCLFTAGTP